MPPYLSKSALSLLGSLPRHPDRGETLRLMATIRPAGTADASALFELVRTFPTPTPSSSEQFSKALHAKLPDPSSCLLVAEHDGRLVGYVSGHCHATFYAGGRTAWVDELLVIAPPAWQGNRPTAHGRL